MEPPSESQKAPKSKQQDLPWFQRLSSPILFLIIGLALVGAYFAFSIPVSVFPNTDFPRIVIGVDNGVMPIDQMLVTITRPIEEAVNSVPGLQKVQSITHRKNGDPPPHLCRVSHPWLQHDFGHCSAEQTLGNRNV